MHLIYRIVSRLLLSGILIYNGMLSAQFKADMLNVRQGEEILYKVYSDGSRYRYDFEEEGMKGIVIVDPVKGSTQILVPEKKFVHHSGYLSMKALMNDPYQAFTYYKNNYNIKEEGKTEMEGYEVKVLGVYSGDTRLFTCWFSDELNFPLRIENNQADDTYMELSNIEKTEPQETRFSVPEDYTEVDERMRPVVAEPEPPVDWEEIQVEIPVADHFNRGQCLEFFVRHEGYTGLKLRNDSEDPAKVVWFEYHADGKIKTGEEQGPLSYRSVRLYPGDSKNLTLNWKTGEKIKLEIHEGTMYVEVMPE